MRIEKDSLGVMDIPDEALYGIHAARAVENFSGDSGRFHIEWYLAMAEVKKACYQTCALFQKEAKVKCPGYPQADRFIEDQVLSALEKASDEAALGKYFDQFIVPAISGGAGTSINMNINEILTNAALIKLGFKSGDYKIIDPVEHANIFQSTNDVVPTALKLAIMRLLDSLEASINLLRMSIEMLEREYQQDLRIGFTQMQYAVPTSIGKLFSSYSDALSRDWWRVSKCKERIKQVNLGGGAIGTGLAIPRFFIYEVTECLKRNTRQPITRSENLSDATSNLDCFVETHATLKSLAVNLEKISNDIRLLASDLAGENRIFNLPQRQVGSSIMPGKINPVIPEFVISCAQKVRSNDQLISSLCASGCLELNAYLPLIGDAYLNSLKLLKSSCDSLRINAIEGLTVDKLSARSSLLKCPSITTALIPLIGYNHASELAKIMKLENLNIYQAVQKDGTLSRNQIDELLTTGNLLKLGYSLLD